MKMQFFEPMHDPEAVIKLPNGKNVHMTAIQLSENEESELEKCYAKLKK